MKCLYSESHFKNVCICSMQCISSACRRTVLNIVLTLPMSNTVYKTKCWSSQAGELCSISYIFYALVVEQIIASPLLMYCKEASFKLTTKYDNIFSVTV